MSYILQNNSGLIGVRLTDAGRKKLSQGNLSLSLFQLGDSEFCYDCYTKYYNFPVNPLHTEYNLEYAAEKEKEIRNNRRLPNFH